MRAHLSSLLQPIAVRAKRVRSRKFFQVRGGEKGLQDLKKAMEDPAFRFGFTGEIEYKEGDGDYDWKDNIKLPREFKVGRADRHAKMAPIHPHLFDDTHTHVKRDAVCTHLAR
jgi:hypothetical protein